MVKRNPFCMTALALTAILGALATGCAPKYTDFSAFVRDPSPLVTSTEYRMAPPDIVLITSKIVREVDGHQEQIRPDGKLTLPLIGSVFVAGMTCEEASALLEQKYREFYNDNGKNPPLSVRVTGFNSKKIFVFGEVGAPGPYPYYGANTVLGTLAVAQPTRLASKGNIQVLRPNRDGKLIKRMTIDLNEMVKKGDTSLDAVLEQNDIIYVPANGFATVGLALQQLLLPIQPAAATVKGPADIQETFTGRTYGRTTGPTN